MTLGSLRKLTWLAFCGGRQGSSWHQAGAGGNGSGKGALPRVVGLIQSLQRSSSCRVMWEQLFSCPTTAEVGLILSLSPNSFYLLGCILRGDQSLVCFYSLPRQVYSFSRSNPESFISIDRRDMSYSPPLAFDSLALSYFNSYLESSFSYYQGFSLDLKKLWQEGLAKLLFSRLIIGRDQRSLTLFSQTQGYLIQTFQILITGFYWTAHFYSSQKWGESESQVYLLSRQAGTAEVTLRCSLKKAKHSWAEGLSLGFFVSSRFTMRFSLSEQLSRYLGVLLIIQQPSMMRFLDLKGRSRVAHWQSRQPRAQMSTLQSYCWCFICSGARYTGVPILVSSRSSSISLDIPRSPILAWPDLSKNILSALMSRCTMPLLWRYLSPSVTSLPSRMISPSLRWVPFSRCLRRQWCRSPRSAYSMTMQSSPLSRQESQKRMTLGCSSWRIIYTSCSGLDLGFRDLRSIRFRTQGSPSIFDTTLQTDPNDPFPRIVKPSSLPFIYNLNLPTAINASSYHPLWHCTYAIASKVTATVTAGNISAGNLRNLIQQQRFLIWEKLSRSPPGQTPLTQKEQQLDVDPELVEKAKTQLTQASKKHRIKKEKNKKKQESYRNEEGSKKKKELQGEKKAAEEAVNKKQKRRLVKQKRKEQRAKPAASVAKGQN